MSKLGKSLKIWWSGGNVKIRGAGVIYFAIECELTGRRWKYLPQISIVAAVNIQPFLRAKKVMQISLPMRILSDTAQEAKKCSKSDLRATLGNKWCGLIPLSSDFQWMRKFKIISTKSVLCKNSIFGNFDPSINSSITNWSDHLSILTKKILFSPRSSRLDFVIFRE